MATATANRVIAASPVMEIRVPEIFDIEAAEARDALRLARGVAAHQFALYAFVLKLSNAGDPQARLLVALCNTEPMPQEIYPDIPFI
jgi:hypothetical protein